MTAAPRADKPPTGQATGRTTGQVPAPASRRRARLVLRLGKRLSLRIDRRVAIACTLTGLLTLLTVGFTLSVGYVHIPLPEVIRAVTGSGNHFDRLIVHTFREPRVLTGLFVGACLGMSGAIFQNMAANPLVSPDIIGIDVGAALALVVVVVVVDKPIPAGTVDAVCLTGSIAAAVLVWVVALGAGRSGQRLVLVGVGVNTTLAAVTTYLMSRANNYQTHMLAGLIGTLTDASWTTFDQLAVPAGVLLAAGTALGRQLELLQLGATTAVSLGAPVRQSRMCLLGVGAGLAAISVAAAGPVGFVAFIAPHIARRLAQSTGNGILPLSAAVGAALVVVADYAAQRALEPTEIPVGILTTLIGGPYFLYLLLRTAKAYTL